MCFNKHYIMELTEHFPNKTKNREALEKTQQSC